MSANSNALLFKLLDAATQGQPPDEPENQIALLTEILENVKNADTLTDDLDLGGNDLTDSTQDTVDSDKNIRVTDSSELSYGRNNGTLGAGSQAIGINARANSDFTTATGFRAAKNNTGNSTTAAGVNAAKNNTGNSTTAAGVSAAENNSGKRTTAPGVNAAKNNTGNFTTATGANAAKNNTGSSTTAIGVDAASGDGLADPTTMGDDNIGIGVGAIKNNQASGLIGIGQEAAKNAQTDDQLIITDRNGNRRMVMDLTNGDLKIEGSLTQNANL
ncbi:hypothetical protein OSG_eHPE5_00035 [environmental Halophage eHP-E5]|nr:hypothetical protein OSG_eHPE5_00035 [environmental Halophage eHP-E5]